MKEEDVKIVPKPWGREVWLELNDKYCYKRLYLNKGYRTSRQYHNQKLETNYIVSGEAIVELDGEISSMTAGDFFTVQPGVIHRITAMTDVVLQEVSTPEVDDVVRVEDDHDRK